MDGQAAPAINVQTSSDPPQKGQLQPQLPLQQQQILGKTKQKQPSPPVLEVTSAGDTLSKYQPLANQTDHIIPSSPSNPAPFSSHAIETRTAMQHPPIQPLLAPVMESPEAESPTNLSTNTSVTANASQETVLPASPQKAVVTRVKLSDDLNLFDWTRTRDIINQLAEKARSSVDQVITVLDPGMKEYLYSGGNINIMVVCDCSNMISPIRDAFQSVFGRATVVGAKFKSSEDDDYPIKLAKGFGSAKEVAKSRISRLRQDTSSVPQNQVVIAVQPCLLNIGSKSESTDESTNGHAQDLRNIQTECFLTYCMILEDPVFNSTMSSFSQFIPLDTDVITLASSEKFKDEAYSNLGYATKIEDLMIKKLGACSDLSDDSESGSRWMNVWCGINQPQLIQDLAVSVAHMYRRKWNDCIS